MFDLKLFIHFDKIGLHTSNQEIRIKEYICTYEPFKVMNNQPFTEKYNSLVRLQKQSKIFINLSAGPVSSSLQTF